jgi:hypothetical protein
MISSSEDQVEDPALWAGKIKESNAPKRAEISDRTEERWYDFSRLTEMFAILYEY